MIDQLLSQRFNKTGNLIYLATSTNNTPSIRSLTPYYENGCFFAITSYSSKKTKEIQNNPNVAICGYFFNANATASLIGPMKLYPELSKKLAYYCNEWIQLGKIDINSDDTYILKIELKDGYIIENNKRYDIKS